jgi:prolyl 4-hydroxylase
MRIAVRVTPAGARPDDHQFLTIDPLLDPDECREWIDFAERLGFYDAPITVAPGVEVHRPDIRNNLRTLVDDPDRASALWRRTEPLLPDHVLRNGRAHATGFNERLRFYRYEPGQCFALHRDGHYRRPDGSETSRMSFLVYLNEGFEGGETDIIDLGVITPKTGLALCFRHPYLHEGREVRSGVKYVLRTDIMYGFGPSGPVKPAAPT